MGFSQQAHVLDHDLQHGGFQVQHAQGARRVIDLLIALRDKLRQIALALEAVGSLFRMANAASTAFTPSAP